MISKAYSIDEQEFIKLIKNSSSCAEALRTLGYKTTTGNAYVTVKRRAIELGIDLSHWADNTKNARIKNKIPSEEFFAKDTHRNTTNLKERIIKENLMEYKCDICGNTGEWNGKKLVLQIDHINGDHTDNRIENLRFLCPNCHTQTDTFAGKNVPKKDKSIKKKTTFCKVCGKIISDHTKTGMCIECFNKTKCTVERPDRKTLAIDVAKNGFCAVGREYNVSDSAIRKWCKSYDLPHTIKALKQYVQEQGWLN